MLVVGVDGCTGGWIAVAYDDAQETLRPCFHRTFRDVLDAYPYAVAFCVDIPIGLGEAQPRRCDVEARQVLGAKGSSVFPAPGSRLLGLTPHEVASACSREWYGKGISVQTYALLPKIEEVDLVMTPELQGRVFEVHPEVCFWALNGKQPVMPSKKTPEGYEERRKLLSSALNQQLWPRRLVKHEVKEAKPDDLLDACVAAWTANRRTTGLAGGFPVVPERNAKGLRMEMVY